MPRNKQSTDEDHVAPEPDPDPPRKRRKTADAAPSEPTGPPPEPWPLPEFKPMKIKNSLQYGCPRDQTVKRTAYEAFSLFFDDETLQELADNTNEYAALFPPEFKEHTRPWIPVSIDEIRAYIATYIWMGLHHESRVRLYWNTDPSKGPIHSQVASHISQRRWEQIDRFFHISKPKSPADLAQNPESVFEKLEPLSERLRARFKEHWESGTHLTVDEAIQRFMGRAKEVVNIPKKPVPEGFKIWVLANAGYVLDWMWHSKGSKKDEGPVDLDDYWTKNLGFSKTQAVVLDLVSQEGISKDNFHVIWLDNLFTSTPLFTQLKHEGFAAAGTARLGQTKREKTEQTAGEPAQKARMKKEKNRGLADTLVDIKLKWGQQLEWGKLFGCVSSNGEVMQFAWKDNNTVLFMSTVADPKATIVRRRRRPGATSTSAKTSWKAFGGEKIKELAIPEFIDLYNHFMNGVDTADQLRSYYGTQRVHVKHWKSLWHFLLDTTITNAYKLTHCTSERPYAWGSKHSSHSRFRTELANELFDRSSRLHSNPPCSNPKPLVTKVKAAPSTNHEQVYMGRNRSGYCVSCIEARRTCRAVKHKRKALNELDPNSLSGGARRKRAPRTSRGCGLCNVFICDNKHCWEEHIMVI